MFSGAFESYYRLYDLWNRNYCYKYEHRAGMVEEERDHDNNGYAKQREFGGKP